MDRVAPGIWRIRLGTPEAATPIALRQRPPLDDALAVLRPVETPPIAEQDIAFATSARGCTVRLPWDQEEEIYGFGLQLKSLRQTRRKRTIRVNADPKADTGDSHAPVPFYVSTNGYGVYVDTGRYVNFYCGSHAPVVQPGALRPPRPVVVDVPVAHGVDIYFFAGPTMKEAVQRYNLFAGGGCLPPLWGLGVMYRCDHRSSAEEALGLARSLRDASLPCDVFGLEPGWHSHAYPCTYQWAPERFPEPQQFLDAMAEAGFKVNLWEHVFVDESSPLYEPLLPYAGDFQGMSGLTPDLSMNGAQSIFAAHHDEHLVAKGVAAFKLDECDNSDFVTTWSFPEHTAFPSGLDGELMHSFLGILYQRTILGPFITRNRRTYGQVRSSHALASPYPFALYSDLYDHRDFIRGVATAGFGGLLWVPEVRSCSSVEDLIRRVQAVMFSPQALINAWYIKHPPWRQFNRDKNNNDELMEDYEEVEAQCRELFKWRMRLIPYLYSAFAHYHLDGTPPFRALVMDYPDDENARAVDDAFLVGDGLLVAPVFEGQDGRSVYLPGGGRWFDFWSHKAYEGGQAHDIAADLDTIPVFVREGSIVPLAQPVQWIADDTCFDLTVYTFGDPCRPFTLFEDDGRTWAFDDGAFNRLELAWDSASGPRETRTGPYPGVRYRLAAWEHVSA
ncbi:MAG: glycoside hydrolase [Candidatus Hydrogenedentes bacterium]|nr:glycoside hydrolase [Candidatus Hydrogenedentota bacterium]